MSLTQKAILFISLTLFVQLGLVYALYNMIVESIEDTRLERDSRITIDEMQNLINRFFEAERLCSFYATNPDPATGRRLRMEVSSFRKSLERLEPAFQSDQSSRRTFTRASELTSEIENLVNSVIDRVEVNSSLEVEKFMAFQKGRSKVRALVFCMQELVNSKKLNLRETSDVSLSRRKSMLNLLILGAVINVAVASGLLLLFVKTIVSKLGVLISNSRLFAEGKELMPQISGRDEIAYLDRSFRQMTSSVDGLIRQVRDSEIRVRSIIDGAPVGIALLLSDGRIESFNACFMQMIGSGESELPDGEISIGRFIDFFNSVSPEAAQPGRAFVTVMKRPDGVSLDVTCSLTRLNDANGPLFILCVTDITERVELERARARFMDVVSHDLRAPLASARIFLGMLSDVTFQAPDSIRERAGRIARSIDSLIGMVNNVLEISRLETGSLSLNIRACNADAIVEASVESLTEYARQKPVVIELMQSDSEVFADFERVQQVLVNLLSNAIKFSSEGAKIEIGTVLCPNGVEFFVKDYACGIPESERHLMFERFRQVGASSAKGGFGLGLSIAREIVELHGSELLVASKEGLGSRFSFILEEV